MPFGRVVAIGGGTGLPAVLRALRQAARWCTGRDGTEWLTAIVTVMDDGGSSGRLRDSLGVLPPGDIRNCLGALARRESPLADILNDRFRSGHEDGGHPIGNLLLAALSATEGDLLGAVRVLGAQMGVSGRVLPATLENVHLRACFEDGTEIRGESAIVAHRGRIRRMSLDRAVRPVPEVIEALLTADLVIVGPGSLYTSLLPNLLVSGVGATISALKAKRVYVANLMTQPGETDDFSLEDHLHVLQDHTGYRLFDYVLVNSAEMPRGSVAHYEADGATIVRYDPREYRVGGAEVIRADLAAVTPCGQIRHRPETLGRALLGIASGMHPCCAPVGAATNVRGADQSLPRG